MKTIQLRNFADFLESPNTKNLALLRFQSHLPEGTYLKSLYLREGFARKTLHFSLNCIPPNVNRKSFQFTWRTHNVLVISPWNSFIEVNGKPSGGNITDLFWLNEVQLPVDTTIIAKDSALTDKRHQDNLRKYLQFIVTSKQPSDLLPAIFQNGGFYLFNSSFMLLTKTIGEEEKIAYHPDFTTFKKFARIEGFISSAHPLTYARLFEGFCILLKTLVDRYDDSWAIMDRDFKQIALKHVQDMFFSPDPIKNAAGSIAALWGDIYDSLQTIISGSPPSEVVKWMEAHLYISQFIGISTEQASSDEDVLYELDFWFPHSIEIVRHLQKLADIYSSES